MDRRTFIAGIGALAACRPRFAGASAGVPFSFESLAERARTLARAPFSLRAETAPEVTARIFYDQHGQIRPVPERALFRGGTFEVTPFHMARLFPRPVRLNAVEGGVAREIEYDGSLFSYPSDNPAADMPHGAGFAGFRVHEGGKDGGASAGDWLAFLGASYFRASGDLSQYGLSARGIAVGTGEPTPEEFPEFTEFWLEEGADGAGPTVHALLDGPSVTGAYRFRTRRGPTTEVDVEARLFFRKDVSRLGIAPLTSMYWYSESGNTRTRDWRPEVHDSDGLQVHTGSGEHVWRALQNPTRVGFSALADKNPRGFGLMQRDREHGHYEDRVFFERRPSLWIEPVGDWGRGSVQLVEIPTLVEFEDNVVAFWSPERQPRAGESLSFAYRMSWCADRFDGGPLARCVATRLDAPHKDRDGVRQRFFVDFEGDALLVPGDLDGVATTSAGTVSEVAVSDLPGGRPGTRRASFSVLLDGSGTGVAELRLSLSRWGMPASETWTYQLEAPFRPS